MQNRRKKRSDFPIGSFLSIAGMLAIVFTIGILAYGRLSEIANTVSDAARPDSRLLLVKTISGDLSIAENSVKTYSLTGDTLDLDPFYFTADAIESKLDSLHVMSDSASKYSELSFILDSLIHEKFAVQRAQLTLRGGNRVNTALDKLSRTLRRADNKVQASALAETSPLPSPTEPSDLDKKTASKEEPNPDAPAHRADKDKKGLVGRIFTRKNKDQRKKRRHRKDSIRRSEADDEQTAQADVDSAAIAQAEDTTAPKMAPLKEVMAREISSIKVREQILSQSLVERSLELTREEQQISRQIQLVEANIESLDRRKIAAKTEAAETAALEVNQLVVFFSISVAALLFLLGLGIYFYFRTTNRYQRSIQKARAEAENLAKARERFLATMSHEIRTPMNAIVGFSDLILKTPLSHAQEEKLQLVKRSADHLLSVVDSVLVYARLAATQLQFEKRPFALRETVALPLDLIGRDAEAKGLELKFTYPDGLPEVVEGDALRLRQVLLNLLGNAVKFTAEGSIELLVEQIYHRRTEIRLRFSVIDTGVGIPGEKKDRVFNEFEQSETSTTRKYGGTGLGLSISKHIVTQQDGKIGLTSVEGKGTTVFFELPLAISEQVLPQKAATPPAEAADWSNFRLLIADDEAYNRKLLNEILRKHKVVTEAVHDGTLVLKALQNENFDLVLLDNRMPEMNGLEAARRIRAGETGKKNKKIPIIALTAVSTDTEMATCIAAGCDDVLQKPFAEADLLNAIRRQLGSPAVSLPENANMQPNTESSSPSQLESSELNLQPLILMSRGDTGFVKEMLSSFLVSLETSRASIQKGLTDRQHKSIAEAAHKLAAPSRHLQAESLYASLKSLERNCDSEENWDMIQSLHAEFEAEADRVTGWVQTEIQALEEK